MAETTTPEPYFFDATDCKFVRGYPGSCSGNLLAWLAHEMGSVRRLDEIEYVEAWNDDHSKIEAYVFNKQDFDFQFNAKYGSVEEIEKLYRLVMRDGATYLVYRCDGEYRQTGLLHMPPVVRPGEMHRGLKSMMMDVPYRKLEKKARQ